MPTSSDTNNRRRDAVSMRITFRDSALGLALIARTGKGIAAILLGDDRNALQLDLQDRFPAATLLESDSALEVIADDVVRFLVSPESDFDQPLDMIGTELQCEVWNALREIPAGTITTYTDVAKRVGRPGSVRAVAHALAANPLAVVVPCHRVIRRDGQLCGYRWGVERKRKLLAHEAAVCDFTLTSAA